MIGKNEAPDKNGARRGDLFPCLFRYMYNCIHRNKAFYLNSRYQASAYIVSSPEQKWKKVAYGTRLVRIGDNIMLPVTTVDVLLCS